MPVPVRLEPEHADMRMPPDQDGLEHRCRKDVVDVLGQHRELPRNLLWARVSDQAAPEPVDGFFWTSPSDHTGRPARLDVVLCAGIRPGRPGFAAYEIAAPLPAEAPGHWGDLEARENGSDFENILPGGELEELKKEPPQEAAGN